MKQNVSAGNESVHLTWEKHVISLGSLRCSMYQVEAWFEMIHHHLLFHTWLLNWFWSHFHLPALEEAEDISIYLMPLKGLFEDMESMEFPEVRRQIGPLMYTVCLVWANSRHYNTPQRLIFLLQETCNLLIQQVSSSYTFLYFIFVVKIWAVTIWIFGSNSN